MRLQNITVGITWDYKKIAVGIIKITVGITFGITKRLWDYSVITNNLGFTLRLRWDYNTVTLGLQYGVVGITIWLHLDYIYIFATRQSGNAKSRCTSATNFTICNVLIQRKIEQKPHLIQRQFSQKVTFFILARYIFVVQKSQKMRF